MGARKRARNPDDEHSRFLTNIVKETYDIDMFRSFCRSLFVGESEDCMSVDQLVFYDYYPEHSDASVALCLYEIVCQYANGNMPYGSVRLCTSVECLASLTQDLRLIIVDRECLTADTMHLTNGVRHVIVIESNAEKYSRRYHALQKIDYKRLESIVNELFAWASALDDTQ